MPRRIAIVSSAHGYGHATRDGVLADEIADRGHAVTLFTAAPAAIVGTRHEVVPWTVDVGLVQRGALVEDLDATSGAAEVASSRERVAALAEHLAAYDLVVADIAPAALEAARLAGVEAVALGNFDWAWIYSHYPALNSLSARFRRWQSPHRAVGLEPGPGLHDFASVRRGGLLARRAASVRVAERTALVCFGGFGLDALATLLPTVPGLTWVLAPPMPRLARPDCVYVDDVPFPSLVAGADLLLSKPGYGVLGEAMVAGTPMVWLDRGSFPEAPFLEREMRERGDEKAEAAGPESIAAAVAKVLAAGRPHALMHDDRAAVATAVLAG